MIAHPLVQGREQRILFLLLFCWGLGHNVLKFARLVNSLFLPIRLRLLHLLMLLSGWGWLLLWRVPGRLWLSWGLRLILLRLSCLGLVVSLHGCFGLSYFFIWGCNRDELRFFFSFFTSFLMLLFLWPLSLWFSMVLSHT